MLQKPDNYDRNCACANSLYVITVGLDVVGQGMALRCKWQYVQARLNGASDVRLRKQVEPWVGERERASLY